jgi:molybdopterin synthase catalytic subunit
LEKINIKLSHDPLHLSAVAPLVETEAAGGTCIFIGTVRNSTKGKTVLSLEFEAYAPMALSEMQKIANAVLEKWPVLKIAIHHRIGDLKIGEIPVIIAISAAHRQAAFEACQFCIDTLKETVPIWKKEIFDDGEVWVSAHP